MIIRISNVSCVFTMCQLIYKPTWSHLILPTVLKMEYPYQCLGVRKCWLREMRWSAQGDKAESGFGPKSVWPEVYISSTILSLLFQLFSWSLILCLPVKNRTLFSFSYSPVLGHSQAGGILRLLKWELEWKENQAPAGWRWTNCPGAKKTNSCPVISIWHRGWRGKVKLKLEQKNINKWKPKEPLHILTTTKPAAHNTLNQMLIGKMVAR